MSINQYGDVDPFRGLADWYANRLDLWAGDEPQRTYTLPVGVTFPSVDGDGGSACLRGSSPNQKLTPAELEDLYGARADQNRAMVLQIIRSAIHVAIARQVYQGADVEAHSLRELCEAADTFNAKLAEPEPDPRAVALARAFKFR